MLKKVFETALETPSVRKFLAAAATAPLLLASGLSSAEEVQMVSVDAEGTIVVQGQNQRINAGKASFEVDLSALSAFKLIKLGASDNTAVIFGGSVEPGRLCPYFDTKSRKKEIRQVGNNMVFRTTTPVSEAEYDAVKRHQCLVAPTAKPREIIFNKKP